MRAYAMIHRDNHPVAGWLSKKSVRTLVLVGTLLAVSLAINATIILLASR